jgi:hypothetical protein
MLYGAGWVETAATGPGNGTQALKCHWYSMLPRAQSVQHAWNRSIGSAYHMRLAMLFSSSPTASA